MKSTFYLALKMGMLLTIVALPDFLINHMHCITAAIINIVLQS